MGIVSIHDPNGRPLRMTHRSLLTGAEYRILHAEVEGWSWDPMMSGKRYYVVANRYGNVFVVDADTFNSGQFEYIPGGV